MIRVGCKEGGPKETGGMLPRLDNECRANSHFNPANSSPTPLAEFFKSHYFGNKRTRNPVIASCHACVIIPGRRFCRASARIPNISPYTPMTIVAFAP